MATIEDSWQRSDAYHNSFLIGPDEALQYARQTSEQNNLPAIAVSTAQGKLLNLLARSVNAKRILEVGALGGFSTIWLARALPEDGELISLELSEKHAQVARGNLEHAGLSSKAQVVTLQPTPPFDLVFIDADKPGISRTSCMPSGSCARAIVDNVVRDGLVADPTETGEFVRGVRTLLEHLKTDREVDATTIATVGEKGYDGFLYAIRL
ncbi:S-adenosyl-L-methionine-dependent methyltransferase [Amylocystis lapponica]|nr:S-adenosyl-L-methionine-dependent methyltransferase [Amylocystis lapponica]